MDCTLIHLAMVFLSEKSEFAELCIKEGFVFVGPSPNVLEVLGNKILAKKSHHLLYP